MIKATLLFLWIFIFPILAWISKLFFSKKKKKIKLDSSQKSVLEVFFLFNIYYYVLILPILFGSPVKNFQEIINGLCIFQITALDIGLLYVIFWEKIHVSKILEKASFFISLFAFIVKAIIFVGIIYFHIVSVFGFFAAQKIPTWLIIFVLLFNPIYMFYQTRERLLND